MESPAKQTFRWDGDTEDGMISTLISAVASVKGVDPMELDALYDVIDPDALETIMGANSIANCQIEFAYNGVQVAVYTSGEGTIIQTSEQ